MSPTIEIVPDNSDNVSLAELMAAGMSRELDRLNPNTTVFKYTVELSFAIKGHANVSVPAVSISEAEDKARELLATALVANWVSPGSGGIVMLQSAQMTTKFVQTMTIDDLDEVQS